MASITRTKQHTYRVEIRKRGYAPISKTFAKRGDALQWASITESGMSTGKHIDISKEARATTGIPPNQ